MIRIGIICPSEIAFRRFLPSLRNVKEFTFAGVAIASPAEWAGAENVTDKTCASIENERIKAQPFIDIYGGKIFEGYETMIRSDEIDAVYLPLPPALHFKWTKRVLECGKHAFVEKPFTTDLTDTRELLRIAEEKGLAVHENYMFVYHNQLKAIDQLIEEGEIGKVRCYRISATTRSSEAELCSTPADTVSSMPITCLGSPLDSFMPTVIMSASSMWTFSARLLW